VRLKRAAPTDLKSLVASITTHVLDTSTGRPAAGIRVVLERGGGSNGWEYVGAGEADVDGRVRTLVEEGIAAEPGLYRLVFDSRGYFGSRGIPAFYPSIVVTFEIPAPMDPVAHFHLPLLLSPFGYTTYRGS
jgi:5-hydroxyisourate hydrolase